MKIILTGGAGFIGSCLLGKLNSKGVNDIIVVDHLGKSEKWKNLVGKKIDDFIDKGAFLEAVSGNKISSGIDMVIHFGACSSTTEPDASYLMENNYCYTKTLAVWALRKKIPFLYASSAATYGNGELGYSDDDSRTVTLKPLNMYGFSKHAFDLWVLQNGLSRKVTGFKFFNVFGPNEYHKGEMRSVIAKVFDRVAAGEPMRLFKSYDPRYGDGEQKRDFVYVKDAIEVVDYFIRHPGKKGIFNLGSGKARSWNDVSRALFSALDKEPRIEYIEMPPVLQKKYQYFTEADLSKLRKAGCMHKFLSLEDAVKDYAGYLKEQKYI
ncbi:MAG: ADP-glyceromanno-heptose 6-epimerase [Candidatus Omnitrophica bacterium]|nr:ADP-glyceromanno-heptose 6-epimerase [Candidatus Omnitrophota bacterium]